jgi:hypothetical protein
MPSDESVVSVADRINATAEEEVQAVKLDLTARLRLVAVIGKLKGSLAFSRGILSLPALRSSPARWFFFFF